MSVAGRVFVDTNVLVYSVDSRAPEKQERALGVLSALVEQAEGAVSTQVLGEFYSVLTRKFQGDLRPGIAAQQVRNLVESWDVVPLTPAVVLEALRGVEHFGLSYYDAQIWAAARVARIEVILSEDFSDGAVHDGVRFVNPFAPDFDVEPLLA